MNKSDADLKRNSETTLHVRLRVSEVHALDEVAKWWNDHQLPADVRTEKVIESFKKIPSIMLQKKLKINCGEVTRFRANGHVKVDLATILLLLNRLSKQP